MYKTDLARLKQCMRKAQAGEELTLGFFGGSITQDSLATKHENCYAYRVFSWWKENFPEAQLSYVNGGIGGTTSHYGVSRVVTDMLMYQPDFVVIDFSVNDEANEFFQETYEGLIRRMLAWPSQPALLLLNNVYYDTGENAQEYHNKVGEWYQIPCVSIRDTVYMRMKAGEFSREEISPDGLHPNDLGHSLVAAEITSFLEQVKQHMWEDETEAESGAAAGAGAEEKKTVKKGLPPAITENAYENAARLTIREVSPELDGFRTDAREKTGHLDHFKNGWIGKKPGDRIRFKVEASCIAIQYRKTISRPVCRAELILDGDEANPVLLDGNFDEDWGDCLYLEPVLHHGEDKTHVLDIRILDSGNTAGDKENQNDSLTPFYLMSVIIAR